MNIELIRRVLDLAVRHRTAVLAVECDGVHIHLERRPAVPQQHADAAALPPRSGHAPQPPAPAAPAAATAPASIAIGAPMTGIVHLSPKPGSPPFVSVGDQVARGQQVAIIEAMKTFSAIKAPEDGHVVAVAVSGGDEVSGGDTIILLRPAGGEEPS